MFGKRRQSSLPSSLAELNATTDRLLQQNATELDRLQGDLTADHERILDYFWNDKKQVLRPRLPQLVIWFFEADSWHETLGDMIRSRVDVLTIELEIKKYVVAKSDSHGKYFELSPNGVAYLKDAHPTVMMYWQRFLQLAPPSVSLLVALVGLVASVFGIIQFIAWVRGL